MALRIRPSPVKGSVKPGSGDMEPVRDGSGPIVFLGRRTLQKLYFLLHLGRMLQVGGLVRLDTVNPSVEEETLYDYCGLEICEYPNVETLLEAGTARKSGAVYHLLDVPEGVPIQENGQLFLITDADRVSVEHAMDALQTVGRLSGRVRAHRIFLDICDGSRISVRYLEGLLMKKTPYNVEFGELFALCADERSWAAILENQHDDRLRLSTLGSGYARLLAGVAEIAFGLGTRESFRRIRLADRRRRP